MADDVRKYAFFRKKVSRSMIFPDTWEEFEKQYGFYDIKRAYMYGNTRLIPSFRVQQWLNHIDDIKRKNQSQKNKMVQLAKLFGKKLDEEFKIKNEEAKFIVKFTEINFRVKYCEADYWHWDNDLLADLITGRAVIINE